jgi:hypothetical protein
MGESSTLGSSDTLGGQLLTRQVSDLDRMMRNSAALGNSLLSKIGRSIEY